MCTHGEKRLSLSFSLVSLASQQAHKLPVAVRARVRVAVAVWECHARSSCSEVLLPGPAAIHANAQNASALAACGCLIATPVQLVNVTTNSG